MAVAEMVAEVVAVVVAVVERAAAVEAVVVAVAAPLDGGARRTTSYLICTTMWGASYSSACAAHGDVTRLCCSLDAADTQFSRVIYRHLALYVI